MLERGALLLNGFSNKCMILSDANQLLIGRFIVYRSDNLFRYEKMLGG